MCDEVCVSFREVARSRALGCFRESCQWEHKMAEKVSWSEIHARRPRSKRRIKRIMVRTLHHVVGEKIIWPKIVHECAMKQTSPALIPRFRSILLVVYRHCVFGSMDATWEVFGPSVLGYAQRYLNLAIIAAMSVTLVLAWISTNMVRRNFGCPYTHCCVSLVERWRPARQGLVTTAPRVEWRVRRPAIARPPLAPAEKAPHLTLAT